jgi:hypothetical protein
MENKKVTFEELNSKKEIDLDDYFDFLDKVVTKELEEFTTKCLEIFDEETSFDKVNKDTVL